MRRTTVSGKWVSLLNSLFTTHQIHCFVGQAAYRYSDSCCFHRHHLEFIFIKRATRNFVGWAGKEEKGLFCVTQSIVERKRAVWAREKNYDSKLCSKIKRKWTTDNHKLSRCLRNEKRETLWNHLIKGIKWNGNWKMTKKLAKKIIITISRDVPNKMCEERHEVVFNLSFDLIYETEQNENMRQKEWT